MLLLSMLLACGGGGEQTPANTDAAPATDAPAADQAEPAEKLKPAVGAPEPEYPRGDGADYDDKWVVILSSKQNGASHELADAQKKLVEAEPNLKLHTLLSSQFKNLSPCYEVAVAGAGSDMKTAAALSKKLKGLGIDNYPKNVGKFVGESAAIDAWCAGGADEGETCPSGVRFVDSGYVRLDVTGELADRLLDSAPAPKNMGGGTQWESKLAAEVVGDYKVGGTLESAGKACTITGFSVLTRGQPHFGWFQHGDQSSPGCGDPEIFAVTDCGGRLAAPAGVVVEGVSQGERDAADPAIKAGTAKVVSMLSDLEADYRAEAESYEGELEVTVSAEAFTVGERTLHTVSVDYTTGEGWDLCGGEELNYNYAAVIEGGTLVLLPVDVYRNTGLLPVLVDGKVNLVVDGFLGETKLLGAGSDPVCEDTVEYCDCMC